MQTISLADDNVQLSLSYADETLQNSSATDSAQLIKISEKHLFSADAGNPVNKILSMH